MSKWLLSVLVALFSAALVATDAEARRFGGARSLGAQRNITPPPKPAQQQAAPAKQSQPAQQAPGTSRWAAIFGGLALGGLLGYLFAGNGLGALVLLALLAAGIALVLRTAAQRRAEAAPRAVQLAGSREEVLVPATGGSAGGIPAQFDTAAFLRAAKRSFLRLQVASDAGRSTEIRELVTDEMFDALMSESHEREGAPTEVQDLQAELLELATEKGAHWASVRFSGRVSEDGGAPQPFEEVWNLVKPVDGSSGWLLAGIQQMH